MSKVNPSIGAITHCDVLVVGAGFGGVSALHRIRKMGYSVKVFESGSSFGGVWYWNRYPGARVDSEFPFYQLSIPEAWKDWNFSQRFSDHRELREYFEHLDKTLDLRKDIQFEAHVNSCQWNAETCRWTVTTKAGHIADCKYLFLATGLLHRRYYPDFPGLTTYKGALHHSGFWPEDIDVKSKKIAIIGAGATSVQIVQELSKATKDGGSLTMFMRRPSYCLPMQQRQLTKEEQTYMKPWYSRLFREGRLTFSGFLGDPPGKKVFEVSEEEREAHFEDLWAMGGFHMILGSYADNVFDPKANRVAYDFWAKKIRSRINDPVKKDLMAPLEPPYPFGTKRTPLEHDYYECLDMDHVEIVNLNQNPLKTFTEKGILMQDGKSYDFDIVVLATGFDSFSGSLTEMGLKNKDGVDLKEVWKDGISSYLGMTISGFPNAFMVYSPQAPTAFSNGPTILECQCDFIVDVISRLESQKAKTIEATPAAAQQWTDMIEEMCKPTLFPLTNSWWTGGNIPGKKIQMLTYPAGIELYERQCRETLDGWKGFDVVTAEP